MKELTRHAWRWSKWIESRSFVRHGMIVTASHACHVDRLTDLTQSRDDATWKYLFKRRKSISYNYHPRFSCLNSTSLVDQSIIKKRQRTHINIWQFDSLTFLLVVFDDNVFGAIQLIMKRCPLFVKDRIILSFLELY
jgi:hypothetical protein